MMKICICVLLLFASFVYLLSASHAGINDGLIAYYPFEGNANNMVTDTEGTEHGNPTYRTGKTGKAINLDGVDDYITADPLPMDQIKDSMSISLWANRIDDSSDDFEGVLVSQVSQYKRAPFGLYFSPTTDPNGPINSFSWYLSGDGTNTELGYGNTPNVFSKKDHWYHVVATFDGANQKAEVYIDGVKQTVDWQNSTIPQMLHNDPGDLIIGSWDYQGGSNPYADSWPFGGKIDELRIYNRALSDDDVAELAATAYPRFIYENEKVKVFEHNEALTSKNVFLELLKDEPISSAIKILTGSQSYINNVYNIAEWAALALDVLDNPIGIYPFGRECEEAFNFGPDTVVWHICPGSHIGAMVIADFLRLPIPWSDEKVAQMEGIQLILENPYGLNKVEILLLNKDEIAEYFDSNHSYTIITKPGATIDTTPVSGFSMQPSIKASSWINFILPKFWSSYALLYNDKEICKPTINNGIFQLLLD